MTGINLPSEQEKQQAMMAWQAQASQAQMSGQPAPEKPKMPPSWEEVIQVLRDDKQRTFKIDIETDSTVAASIESDMQGLRDVLTSLNQVMQGFGPAVQMGAMPVDALKEIMLVVTRRAKMGNAVEDAFDKIKQPPPQEQKPQDNSLEVEQLRQQGDMQKAQVDAQTAMQKEQLKAQADAQNKQIEAQRDIELEKMRLDNAYRIAIDTANIQRQTALDVAQINQQTTIQSSQISASNQNTND